MKNQETGNRPKCVVQTDDEMMVHGIVWDIAGLNGAHISSVYSAAPGHNRPEAISEITLTIVSWWYRQLQRAALISWVFSI